VDKETVGKRLKAIRAERGLSLAQVERATGVSSSFLSLVEQGRSDISLGRLLRLAELYDLELTEMVFAGPRSGPADIQVVRPGGDTLLTSRTEGIEMHVLADPTPWALAPWLFEYDPGATVVTDGAAGREVFFYVLDGAPSPRPIRTGSWPGSSTKTKTITGGQTSVSVDLTPGTYTFFCSVPGHEQAGMKGTLTVK
jgi:transcriptional regulator with XRE-family HTH domain